jgi:hypothetical protein
MMSAEEVAHRSAFFRHLSQPLQSSFSLVQAAKAKARGYSTFRNLKTMIYVLTGKLDYSTIELPT